MAQVTLDQAIKMALAHQRAGRYAQAESLYRQLLALRPDFFPALLNLGALLSWQGHDDQAETLFRRAVEVAPHRGDGWTNLGNILRRKHRLTDAAACHQKAIALQPTVATAYNNLGSVLRELGQSHEAVALFRKATELAPTDLRVWSNYLLSLFYDPTLSAAAIADEHRAWAQRFESPPIPPPPRPPLVPPDRPLRVALLSPDFCAHSVSFFIEGFLAAHDRARIDLFCYADGLQRDAVTARLQSIAPHWRDVGSLTDDQLAQALRADAIDILLDLAGHTAGGRPLLFARRAAPLQISYLGYLGTTGLHAMDFRLTDAFADPPDLTAPFYSETLCRLPQTFACYRPPAHAPPVAPSPFQTHGHITFGSFNVLSKIHPETFVTWSEILHRCPTARLLMIAGGLDEPATRASILHHFANADIPPDRLDLRGHLDFPAYLTLHASVDIALDTFPVVGHTVTCHALWMGVPVITRAGETYFSRLGASVLSNCNLPDLIADSEARYIDLAVSLAHDPARLTALRSTMRSRLRSSPLLDESALARHLETALHQLWNAGA